MMRVETEDLVLPTSAREFARRADGIWKRHSAGELKAPNAMMPGAFNPLHQGHRAIAQLAASRLGLSVPFELSIENVDKAALDRSSVVRRVQQFPADAGILLTRAATFVQKSRLFPGTTFIVGADTLLRIADPGYYDQSRADRDSAIAEIDDLGCRFLVFGRLVGDSFCLGRDLELPGRLAAICEEIEEADFRLDISSTELRRAYES